MNQYVVPFTNTAALFPLDQFYGYDHPLYLDVFVEFGEDRTQITDMIGNAIVQRNVHRTAEFREMIMLQLGYMGISSDEETFYERVIELISSICYKCSPYIQGGELTFIEAIEEADWVVVVYREVSEALLCNIQPSTVSTNQLGSQGTTLPVNSTPDYLVE